MEDSNDSELARINGMRAPSINAVEAGKSRRPATPMTLAALGTMGESLPHVDQLVGRLQCQLRGRVSDFRLLLRENGLVLKGQAHSYYAKQLAQEIVMKAMELAVLANEIEVLSPTPVEGNEW